MFYLILFGFTLVCYWPCLEAPPVFDDIQLFRREGWGKWTWWDYVGRLRWFDGRYLTEASWDVTRKIVPEPYQLGIHHLGTVLLHGLNACIIMWLAQAAGYAEGHAQCAALIFAVHPLAAAAVAPIITRSSVLSATFLLLMAWNVLAGHHVWSALALLWLACMAKEDGIAGLPLLLWLAWPAYWIVGSVAIMAAVRWKSLLNAFRTLRRENGDESCRAAGLPTSLTQPWYSLYAIPLNLFYWQLWMFGLRFNPDHDVRTPPIFRVIDCGIVFAVGVMIPFLIVTQPVPDLAASMILLSPWAAGWFFRMPDIIFESRAYFTVAGIALLLAPVMAQWPWLAMAVLTWFGCRTAVRCWHQSDPIRFWNWAWKAGSHKLRVALNLGAAYQGIGQMDKAKEWHDRALSIDPQSGIAFANIGLWHEGKARMERMRVSRIFILTGTISAEEWTQAVATAKEEMRRANIMMGLAAHVCPDDPNVQRLAPMVREHAANSGVK